ncbi:hypothetical protein GN958_ATG17791, partial [Phytophthora infestans]
LEKGEAKSANLDGVRRVAISRGLHCGLACGQTKIGGTRMVRAVWRAAKTKTGGAKRGRAQFGIGGVEHNQFGDRGCTGDTSDATEPYDRVRH